MSVIGSFKIGKTDYVVLPRAEYVRMGGIPEGSVDALEYARASIATSLRVAREAANLSQPELAKKLRKSQSMVAGAEAGRIRVSERYVLAVLKACGLPKDWAQKTGAKGRRAPAKPTRGSPVLNLADRKGGLTERRRGITSRPQ
jgi:transcriptional regulator with XRE-family HTH domain